MGGKPKLRGLMDPQKETLVKKRNFLELLQLESDNSSYVVCVRILLME